MVSTTSTNLFGHNEAAIGAAIDNITAGLERVMMAFVNLKGLLMPEGQTDTAELDPKNPANKYKVGPVMKLTTRGTEVCYRLFDAGKSKYAVGSLMDISFGAAAHRHKAWEKLGGVNRVKQPLD